MDRILYRIGTDGALLVMTRERYRPPTTVDFDGHIAGLAASLRIEKKIYRPQSDERNFNGIRHAVIAA